MVMMDTTEDDSNDETMLSLLYQLLKMADDGPEFQAMFDSNNEILTEKPDDLIQALIPFLFEPTKQIEDDTLIASGASLKVLSCLVAWKPDLYLKSASRAVKDTLQARLQTPAAEDSATFCISTDLLKVLIEQLVATNDVEVSENAVKSVVFACQLSPAAFATEVLELLRSSLVSTIRNLRTDRVEASTQSVRCLSTVVQLACLGDAAMQAAIPSLDMLVSLLQDSTDPLLQVSMLDLLEQLTSTKTPVHATRAAWCLRSATRPLLDLAGDGNEPDPFIGGSSLRALASICHAATLVRETCPEATSLLQSFPSVLQKSTYSNADERLVLIDAISSFASISETTMGVVLQHPATRETWLSLTPAQPPLKSAILVSVAKVLIATSKNEDRQAGNTLLTTLASTNDRSDVTQVLVPLLSTSPVGAYALLEAIVEHIPAQARNLLPNVLSTLLLRDATKEIREARYSVIQTILQSPGVKECLVDDVVKELQERADNGPHYVKPVRWEVAEQ